MSKSIKIVNIDFLQAELERVSNWIEFADKKAGFLAIFYSSLIGILVSKHKDLVNSLYTTEGLTHILYAVCFSTTMVLTFFGLLTLFQAVIPNLKNLNTKNNLFYYGIVAKTKVMDYITEMESISESTMRKQFLEQLHTNSSIANKKMQRVQDSLYILFILVIPFIYIIVTAN